MAAITQFKQDATRLSADLFHRKTIQDALGKYYIVRDGTKAKFRDWQQARNAAARVKWDSVNHLDRHLETWERQFTARGGVVHWARNGAEARDIILKIAADNGVRSVIKSKCMTSEEIHLNAALERQGCEVVESDLGEFIQQLRGEAPYHFVFPCMHLTRGQIRELFHEKLGTESGDSPEELTMVARAVLRQAYLKADLGISGGNFLVAETGAISITENEGNARLTCALPKIHIALVGIEKVLPRLEDLALFLPMLATAGTGQALTCYNTLYHGPRRAGESDGPEQFHVVLLDNHRTRLLADAQQRDALGCIRCGACLNVCPIFKNIGGLSYGTTYQGPIGSVITPHFRGLQEWKHLSGASSLCGACTEACPVKIDIHHHLLHNRRNAMAQRGVWWERLAFRGFAWFMRRPALYRWSAPFARLGFLLRGAVDRTALDPGIAWTATRDLPPAPERTFQEWWASRQTPGGKNPS